MFSEVCAPQVHLLAEAAFLRGLVKQWRPDGFGVFGGHALSRPRTGAGLSCLRLLLEVEGDAGTDHGGEECLVLVSAKEAVAVHVLLVNRSHEGRRDTAASSRRILAGKGCEVLAGALGHVDSVDSGVLRGCDHTGAARSVEVGTDSGSHGVRRGAVDNLY